MTLSTRECSNPVDLDGSGQILARLLRTMLDSAPQRPEALREAALAGDARTAESLGHRLDAVAGSLGAMRMSRIYGEIESLGRAGTTEGLGQLVGALEAEYEAVSQAMARQVPAEIVPD